MKNSKKNIMAILAAIMSLGMAIPTHAAAWKRDSTGGWWWQEDNGSYPVSQWKWIDGNKDGIAECYYFNTSGYLVTNSTTPDGYAVNSDGAWTVNGITQTQNQNTNTAKKNIATALSNLLSASTKAKVKSGDVITADSGEKYTAPITIGESKYYGSMSFELGGRYSTLSFTCDKNTDYYNDLSPNSLSSWEKAGAVLTVVDENGNIILEKSMRADNAAEDISINVEGLQRVDFYIQAVDTGLTSPVTLIVNNGIAK